MENIFSKEKRAFSEKVDFFLKICYNNTRNFFKKKTRKAKKMKQINYYKTYQDDFVESKDQDYKLPDNYKWVHSNPFYKMVAECFYRIAYGISFFYCKFFLHIKIKNKKVLKKYKNQGYFLYGNHTLPVGDVFTPAHVSGKRIYTIASAANLKVKIIGNLLPMLGILPIPNSTRRMKEFFKAIKQRILEKKCVVIYPEAHVWPYYTKIRPFASTSFKFPVEMETASFCMTTTYQKKKWGKKPKITIYVDGPFIADANLSKKEKQKIEGVSDKSIKVLNQTVQKENQNNFVKKIDITKLFEKEMPVVNLKTHFTPCCMLRLFADEIQELPDKILYLDNDVMVRKDFSNFYHQDMSKYELAGVLDHYGKWFFKKKLFQLDYINSGVLLLNLSKIKQTKLFEKARKMCQTKKMFMPDQSSLNKLASYKKIEPRKFNEQRKLREDTVLQHFTTSLRFFPLFHTITIKPWHIEKIHHKLKIFEYDDILNEYQNLMKEIEGV